MISVPNHPVDSLHRKKVLIVNCYLDETRRSVARTHKVPQAMAPTFLAGAFCARTCEVRLRNEQFGGPLCDVALLGWADMLVLTGLSTAIDRMRQLTAYARTRNPRVVVVAGGYAVSALPSYCRRFFDYCCLGGIEEIREVIRDAWGDAHVAETLVPRYDLTPWVGRIGYVETSRHCNFRCAFCTLTAEGRAHENYDLDFVRQQILALGRRDYISFLDNNFYGPNRQKFTAKLEMLGELWKAGYFKGWMALVTGDFFLDDRNLELAKSAGCKCLFSGVESLDSEWLSSADKLQNVRQSPIEIIRKTLDAGIVFLYGLVLDVTQRHIADMRHEIESIVQRSDITLPGYISVSIPILGTPFFQACMKKDLILPRTKVRDLDGSTLSVRTLDPLPAVVEFMRGAQHLEDYRGRVLRQLAGFVRRYRFALDLPQLALAASNAAILCAPLVTTAPAQLGRRRRDRTFVSTTDVLDDVYTPTSAVAERYARYFEPTMITDEAGKLVEALADDLRESRGALTATAGRITNGATATTRSRAA